MRLLPLLLGLLVLGTLPAQASDVPLEGVRLEAFLKSGGQSELGRNVRFIMPAKVLALPRTERRGAAEFLWKRVHLVVRTDDPGLAEVQRRSRIVRVRGRMIRTTADEQTRGAPALAFLVQGLAHLR